MSLLINLANISRLRRLALRVLILLLAQSNRSINLYKSSTEQVQELIDILKGLISMIREYDHIILIDEPWDKILVKIAEDEYINIDDKEKIAEYVEEIIRYLRKILDGRLLNEYEKDKLHRFLLILINVPISEEYRLLKTLRG